MSRHIDTTTLRMSKICDKTSFGDVLDAIRQKRKLSQDDLSDRLHYSPSKVCLMLHNSLPQYFGLEDVKYIARHLKCDEKEFVLLTIMLACHRIRDLPPE